MNNLRHMKQFQSNANGPPKADELDEKLDTDGDEFIDLSNIHKIKDLNQLKDKRNEPLNMDQIDVELDEDELEHMQRLMDPRQQDDDIIDDDNAIDIKEQSIEEDYAVDTPLSNLSQEKMKQQQMKHNNQIQSELRQLLA